MYRPSTVFRRRMYAEDPDGFNLNDLTRLLFGRGTGLHWTIVWTILFALVAHCARSLPAHKSPFAFDPHPRDVCYAFSLHAPLADQESRTLEMNNVQNGVWHGRGDTICLARGGEGSTTFTALRQPPSLAIRSPIHCSMERTTDDNKHSWSLDTSHSKPLVPADQLA